MEVIIAMVIIAILTAIALPNYTAYIQRSNRSDARSQLLEATLWMERFRTQVGTYVGADAAPPAGLPNALRQAPSTGTPKYNITLTGLTATTYLVTAVPTGVMAGDVCGALTINQLGRRETIPPGPDWCWTR
jgi:type IV pilus assembly protein PilE